MSLLENIGHAQTQASGCACIRAGTKPSIVSVSSLLLETFHSFIIAQDDRRWAIYSVLVLFLLIPNPDSWLPPASGDGQIVLRTHPNFFIKKK